MRLLIILFLLLPTLLFSQEYHVRGCDSRFYKMKTYKVLVGEDAVEYKFCEERRRWPDGKYYFYYDVDTLLKKPYQYNVIKNGSYTYRKKVGKRKREVNREFAYLGYYENGVLRSEEGSDSGAFDWRNNFNRYYDSSGNLYWKWRLSFKGIDEYGNVLENTESLILNKDDTISYTLSYGTGEHADNGYHYSTIKKNGYDSITNKKISESTIITISRGSASSFSWDYYQLYDTVFIAFNEKGEAESKNRNVVVNTDKYKREESYINDSLVNYRLQLSQDLVYDDSCDYAEFHSNGIPKYLKVSLCGMDTLTTIHDSTGEETYREEFFVTKHYDDKIQQAKRYTYLYKPNRQRYLIKKEVCRRKRCRCWWYDNDGKLVKKKRYRKQYQ